MTSDPVSRILDPNLMRELGKIRDSMGLLASSQKLKESIQGFGTQKGIYKPKGSDYALWIRQTIRGGYPDESPTPLPDGSWLYRYTSEVSDGKSSTELHTNRSLLRSMEDHVPVGVFIQQEGRRNNSTYEVMGLAYVEKFDGTHFLLHGEPIDIEDAPINENAIPPFAPFDPSEDRITAIMMNQRRKGFQTGLRRLYHERCSLCEIGYHFRGEPIGLQAAHLIPVSEHGTSKDLRNGILLCNNHHSLFDRYLWTFDEDFRVVVKDDPTFRRSAENNHILKTEGARLPNLPDREYDLPAMEAIRYRMDQFERTQ